MEAEQKKQLFVGGIAGKVNILTLEEYFSQFGDVENCMIPLDKFTGQSRGFGYVTFTDQLVAERVLEQHHFILGRKIDVKPAKPLILHERNQGNLEDQEAPFQVSNQIFVGGLPDPLTEEEFIDYFAKFGAIVDCIIVCDKKTNTPRGFGFITFESEEAVNDVLQTSFHELKNKMVEVHRRARPRVRNHKLWENRYDCERVRSEFGGGYQNVDIAFRLERLFCGNCGGAYGYEHFEGCMYGPDPYNEAWSVRKSVLAGLLACDVYHPPNDEELLGYVDRVESVDVNPEAANLIHALA